MDRHRVGIAEYRLAHAPDRLQAHGLGSCLAVILHDAGRQSGALAHVLLPEPGTGFVVDNPATYVESAVAVMLEALEEDGSHHADLVAKLVGGSQMFDPFSERVEGIGVRNVNRALEVLARVNIPLVGQETGGNQGRSLEYDPASGEVTVRTVRSEKPKVL